MDPFIGGSLIGAGGSLIGGFFDRAEAQKQGAMSRDFAGAMFDKNWQMQKEFAQNSIAWRTEDAKRAGIHPLAALGASVGTGSPVTVGADFDMPRMGQNIERAIHAFSPERKRAMKLQELAIDRGEAENDLVRTQAASARLELLRQAQNPAMPDNSPKEWQYFKRQDGSIGIEPSDEFARSAGMVGSALWELRNRATPHHAAQPAPGEKSEWKPFPFPASFNKVNREWNRQNPQWYKK